MTNMEPILRASEHLAGQSPWVWLICLVAASISGMVMAVRYAVVRIENLLSDLSKVQESRLQTVHDLYRDKENQSRAYAERLERLTSDNTNAKHELAVALHELSNQFGRFQDANRSRV